jgi:sarcosine oxidase subunit gamma
MTRAAKPLRRSPLHDELARPDIAWRALDDASIAWAVPGDSTVVSCKLVDLSSLPRIGFKGWNAWNELRAAGLPVPARNHTLIALAGGGACVRLGDAEALILADPDGDTMLPAGVADWPQREGFYPVPRRDTHAWIALVGDDVPELLAKACGVDFRLSRFADLTLAQTIVAGIGAIVLRWDRAGVPVFHLLVDSSSAVYLWRTILEVAAAQGGRVGGLEFFAAGPSRLRG